MLLQLNDLAVDCILGDLPAERVTPQRLRVALELEVEESASLTDRLEDTVDYAAVAARARQTLVAAECRMLERAVRLVAEAVLESPRVRQVRVAITKFGAVPNLESATAVLTLKREAAAGR